MTNVTPLQYIPTYVAWR